MVWRVKKVEEERKLFIDAVQNSDTPLTHLCQEFGISRKTAYKWMGRYNERGIEGLKDQSRARHTQASAINKEDKAEILRIKIKEKVGPKKILAILQRNYPDKVWPSITSIHHILEENGLVEKRKLRKRFPAKTDPLSHCLKPNDIWCIDFKGWIKTKDGVKFDPLTITDAYSRYLLHCGKLLINTGEYVWEVLSRAFHEYGLPIFLRHDNGPPFATNGAGRLSRLSVNLIKAGVIPEWIEPGKPYQNARHERMHLSMKQWCMSSKELSLIEQTLKLSEFVDHYNNRRPHEALGQLVPKDIYITSSRKWSGQLKSPEYSEGYKVRRVRDAGQVSWNGKDIYVGKVLKNEYVGFKETEEGLSMYYGPVFLGEVNVIGKLILPQEIKRRKGNYKVRIY
jgi:transposase InsO family protein/transposase-like protein